MDISMTLHSMYDVKYAITTRKWPISFIVISSVVLLVCTLKVFTICWICHCKKRDQYVSIQ